MFRCFSLRSKGKTSKHSNFNYKMNNVEHIQYYIKKYSKIYQGPDFQLGTDSVAMYRYNREYRNIKDQVNNLTNYDYGLRTLFALEIVIKKNCFFDFLRQGNMRIDDYDNVVGMLGG